MSLCLRLTHAPPTPRTRLSGKLARTISGRPTLEGQYIIKNLVLISAGLVLASTLRGGRIVAAPYEQGSPARAERGWEAVPARQVVRRSPDGKAEE